MLKLSDLSLFEKLVPEGECSDVTSKISTVLLNLQYRMHPVINAFGNSIIRRNVLTAGVIEGSPITEATRETVNRGYDALRIDRHMSFYPFFLVSPHKGKERDHSDTSESSIREAKIVNMVVGTYAWYTDGGYGDILIVTPYAEQRRLIQNVLNYQEVEVMTVKVAEGR